MALYEEYAALTQHYKAAYGPDAVVLMEVGSFMEWYDCDRRLGADVPRLCALLNVQVSFSPREAGGGKPRPLSRAKP